MTAVLASFMVATSTYAAPPGTIISNQASLDFLNSAGLQVTVSSNTVDLVTAVIRSPSGLELTRVVNAGSGAYQETVGPSACFQGGSFSTLADPLLIGGTVIDPTLTQDVSPTAEYALGEPVFIRLTDTDQNVDAAVIDYAVVTALNDDSGDAETIRLAETGIDTGVFAGYVPTANGAAVPGDCVLQGSMNTSVRVTYTDPADAADASQAQAAFDPLSIVFESRTGGTIDGATVELVDAVTGVPATVYGNDGVSVFPSSITSGATESDSSGVTYAFGPGEYRFPVVPSGNYRLVVSPPPNHSAPSIQSIADLQMLPGAPYTLGPPSFNGAFSHSGPLSFVHDLPIDPVSTALFLSKTSLTSIAAPGDFVRYDLVVENTSAAGFATNVRIVDQLPQGVRYVSGSTTADGTGVPDPVISADLGMLDFTVGDIAAGQRVRVQYVIEIVAGARNAELINLATAYADGGLISNSSNAIVRLTEDLFRSTSTLIGRVVEGDCTQDVFGEDQGVANVRIYLEDGRYAVSDDGGRFHFEGLKPGTHVAQLDPESVPGYFDVAGCDTAQEFAGRADSQFVKLSRGSMKRADFYLRSKEAPEGQVDIAMRNLDADSADEVHYEIELNGEGNIAIRNLDLRLLLPDGVSYKAGTLKIDGEVTADPRLAGPSMTVEVPDQAGNWTSVVRFTAAFDDGADGELITKAFAQFDSPMEAGQKTPVIETNMAREPAIVENAGYVLNLKFDVLSADLSTDDQLELGILIEDFQGVSDIQIAAIGHSDSTPITAANRHLFADNYVLSEARATAAAYYIARALDVPMDRIQVEGRGPDDPVASNTTADGRQSNRRVEMILSGVRPARPSFLDVTQASSGTHIAETQGAVPGAEEEALEAELRRRREDQTGMPSSQVEPDIESLSPGFEVLLPSADFQPAIPATKIAVKHALDQNVLVFLNGKAVNALNFIGTAVNEANTVAVSSWHGVDLQDGVNEIRIEVRDAGGVTEVLERTLNYSGNAIRGEVVSEMSVLVADGKTRPLVAVRLYDRSGNPSRQGTVGAFRVDGPYRSWWEVEDSRKNQIVTVGSREPTYRVGPNGIALLELEPTTQTGEVTLQLRFDNQRVQELRTWLSPKPRDWILVGFGEGTVGYNTLSDNMVEAADAGFDDGYYDGGRVAFFAKGQVKGEYLLTLAYDSARDRDESRHQFQTEVDPHAYYTLYADTSEQRFEAASQRKLFVKIERQQFYALFGDYDTGLSHTELSRYERRFNGLKAGFQGENVGYTAFAAETDQSFVRDELRGDGTSGLYYLSSTPIIGNSETIRIEVRDRFDTGRVLSTDTMTRFLDYNLDILDGSLFFKQPVPSRDQNFNPIFIVAEYESFSDLNEDVVAGGRGSVRFSDGDVEVGLTHIIDGQQGAESDLTGVDLRWQVSDETQFRAEFASSKRIEAGTDLQGSAHALYLEHHDEKSDFKAYIKEVESDFGLGQQSAAEQGIRKLAVDGRAQVSERFYVDGEATWQQNLDTEAIRGTARAQLRYENNGFTATTGLVHAQDKFADGDQRTSDLAEVGVSQQMMNGRMTLRANGNFEMSRTAENMDYPASIILGADYKVRDGVDIYAEYEDATGRDIEASMTRLGVRASPWSRAQVNSTVTNESTEFGPRLFANLGLVQGFQLNENWVLDIGLDQTNTIIDPNARQFNEDRELGSGSFNDDFLAVFVGAAYNNDLWSANSRVEFRNSDTEERTSLIAGWYREPQLGHGLSAGLAAFRSENISGAESTVADLRFGWAWRRAGSRWSFLNRTDLIFEDTILTDQTQESRRLVNNFNANRRMSENSQLALQYAFKYVRSTFDLLDVSGYTDLIGADFRNGFGERWDAGIHTSIYHSYRSKVVDYGFGLDVGLNVADNLWVTLGYNVHGFHDEDFASARYTAQGPYLQISIKADQHTLKSIAGQR